MASVHRNWSGVWQRWSRCCGKIGCNGQESCLNCKEELSVLLVVFTLHQGDCRLTCRSAAAKVKSTTRRVSTSLYVSTKKQKELKNQSSTVKRLCTQIRIPKLWRLPSRLHLHFISIQHTFMKIIPLPPKKQNTRASSLPSRMRLRRRLALSRETHKTHALALCEASEGTAKVGYDKVWVTV